MQVQVQGEGGEEGQEKTERQDKRLFCWWQEEMAMDQKEKETPPHRHGQTDRQTYTPSEPICLDHSLPLSVCLSRGMDR